MIVLHALISSMYLETVRRRHLRALLSLCTATVHRMRLLGDESTAPFSDGLDFLKTLIRTSTSDFHPVEHFEIMALTSTLS